MHRAKQSEAHLYLKTLMTAVETHVAANGELPTLEHAVCTAGGRAEPTAADATDWDEAPWPALRFLITEEHRYRYCITVNATEDELTLSAKADLDGDDVIDSHYCAVWRADDRRAQTPRRVEPPERPCE